MPVCAREVKRTCVQSTPAVDRRSTAVRPIGSLPTEPTSALRTPERASQYAVFAAAPPTVTEDQVARVFSWRLGGLGTPTTMSTFTLPKQKHRRVKRLLRLRIRTIR